jgi:hypothetical protein
MHSQWIYLHIAAVDLRIVVDARGGAWVGAVLVADNLFAHLGALGAQLEQFRGRWFSRAYSVSMTPLTSARMGVPPLRTLVARSGIAVTK